MTRRDLAAKVAKLMKLSRDNPNPNEARAARERAEKIVREHSLTLEELCSGKKARAFDDLVAALRRSVEGSPDLGLRLFNASGIVSGILTSLEKMGDADKSRRLDEAGKLIEIAADLNSAVGKIGLRSELLTNLKKAFDDTLEAHDLVRT